VKRSSEWSDQAKCILFGVPVPSTARSLSELIPPLSNTKHNSRPQGRTTSKAPGRKVRHSKCIEVGPIAGREDRQQSNRTICYIHYADFNCNTSNEAIAGYIADYVPEKRL
jgi:hypothetical protein